MCIRDRRRVHGEVSARVHSYKTDKRRRISMRKVENLRQEALALSKRDVEDDLERFLLTHRNSNGSSFLLTSRTNGVCRDLERRVQERLTERRRHPSDSGIKLEKNILRSGRIVRIGDPEKMTRNTLERRGGPLEQPLHGEDSVDNASFASYSEALLDQLYRDSAALSKRSREIHVQFSGPMSPRENKLSNALAHISNEILYIIRKKVNPSSFLR
eukprot:TRINITY_DN13706_c0_g1_i1.p1 TRINITY_DN13706_c0_g1~~TRINITY_DN13706_c0_g1_i1.p1  ORF type:complete len:215 (+),score=38.77 TRINITY_DN13706_c0_g1_i1:64-708(+)